MGSSCGCSCVVALTTACIHMNLREKVQAISPGVQCGRLKMQR
jgi:hypothetical protein